MPLHFVSRNEILCQFQQNLIDWGRKFCQPMIQRLIIPLIIVASPLLAQEEWVELEEVEAVTVADISQQSRDAAEAGDAAAQLQLARCYFTGCGVPQSTAQAMQAA